MPLSVAILYAGRWFGRGGQHFIDNHVQNLIGPALASATVSVHARNEALLLGRSRAHRAPNTVEKTVANLHIYYMFEESVTAHGSLVAGC